MAVVDRGHPWPAAAHLAAEKDWKDALTARLAVSGGRILIFVHGFNNTPAQAVERTALIARKAQFTGPVLAFTWPSRGDTVHYTWDEQNVAWTEKRLLSLVGDVIRLRPDVQIVLVSHSMGNRAALHTLARLSDSESSHIEQVVLASPDVDRDVFAEELEPLNERVRRITVYTSFRDQALKSSWNVHGSARAGDPSCNYDFWRRRHGPGPHPEKERTCYPSLAPTVRVVDTSGVSTGLGHADFVESDLAAADLCRLLATPPLPNPDRARVPEHDNVFYLKRSGSHDRCGD
jgi:pimeloyl-ACP methyl ester carboxylesterase